MPARSASRIELDPFDRQVEAALELWSDPAQLGASSPLAAPYFLGQALGGTAAAAARERGETLRRLLSAAAATLDAELRALLQITWFARNPAHDNVALALALHLSDRTFYRTRNLAIKALAQALQQQAAPAVRMESPPAATLVGRAALLEDAHARLLQGRSQYLVGPSGVGKSALAAALAQRWATAPAHAVFWYPLRRHASDNAAGLLFLLGWWLHTQDAAAGNCWRQLVADHTIVDLEQILSVLRFDLEQLRGRPLLFCFDDVDVLGEERVEHAHILRVLEVLRSHAPLLLNGQRQLVESDDTLVLAGLAAADAAALFAAAGTPPPADATLAALVAATRGHPALLRLLAALAANGDDLNAALADLGRMPTFEAIFQRIWRQLSDAERALALQLAVFRRPAPLDAWRDEQATLALLRGRGLLVDEAQTSVALAPHLRRLFLERAPPELLPALHARAAEIRAARAEATRAAEHALEAGEPARAVWLWYTNRRGEIDRGQGPHALELLRSISLDALPDTRDRAALQVARAELYQLAGRADEAVNELAHLRRRGGRSGMDGWVQLLGAQAQEMAGRTEQALEAYREAVELFTGLHAQHEVEAHLRLSFLHMYRRHEVDAARREAILARAKADAFLGDLDVAAGRFESALVSLNAAAAALDAVGDDLRTRSRVCTYLSTCYGRLGQFALALQAIERAIDCDLRRGDTVAPLYSRLNRAWLLKEMGRAAESEAEARGALAAAEQLRDPYLIAGLAAGVAEACWAQGKLDETERYALYSLQQEEEFFRAPACIQLALVRLAQGRRGEADALLQAALANSREIGDRATEATVWRDWGRALLHAPPDAESTSAAQAALAQAGALFAELGLAHEVAAIAALSAPTLAAAGAGAAKI